MPVSPFKRRKRPVIPTQETPQGGPLWDRSQKGRDVSVANAGEDIERGVRVMMRQPQDLTTYVRDRLRSYQDQGPDINKPVPLTRNPYRNRRRKD